MGKTSSNYNPCCNPGNTLNTFPFFWCYLNHNDDNDKNYIHHHSYHYYCYLLLWWWWWWRQRRRGLPGDGKVYCPRAEWLPKFLKGFSTFLNLVVTVVIFHFPLSIVSSLSIPYHTFGGGFAGGVLVPVIIIIVPFELTILGLTLGFDSSIYFRATDCPSRSYCWLHIPLRNHYIPWHIPSIFNIPTKCLVLHPMFLWKKACSLYWTGLPNFQG